MRVAAAAASFWSCRSDARCGDAFGLVLFRFLAFFLGLSATDSGTSEAPWWSVTRAGSDIDLSEFRRV